MAANFSDEDFAIKLQAQFDKEARESLEKDLKNTYSRTSKKQCSHIISDSDSDSDVTLDPDLECTNSRNVSSKVEKSGTDSDVTLSPDSDWERPTDNLSLNKNSSNNDRSTLKGQIDKNTNANLQRKVSKIHEISDSDEDLQDNFSKRNKLDKIKRSSSPKKCNSEQKDGAKQGKEVPVDNRLKRKRTMIVDDEEQGPSKKGDKPVCQYGSKCYRKNPSHLDEFYHPENHQSPSTSTGKGSVSPSPAKKVKTTKAATPYSTYEDGQPYSFFLTKVHGIENVYNKSSTMDVKDILSPSMGNLLASCQFNYMFEIPWLMKQYPEQFRSKPLLLVHGFKGPSKASLEAEGASYSNIRFCQARLDMPYGTHHTKMMLLLYDSGMRVVIHTSNMIERDWFQKTQGMWISPLFPKLSKPSSTLGESPTRFKHDLLEYINAYQAYQLKDWKEHINQHDMSTASVFIVGSCPGRHMGEKKTWFGHMKLRRLLHEHGPAKDLVKSWPVIGQYSSVGTLGPAKETWLCTEWLQSLATVRGTSAVPLSAVNLQLIFPTKDEVRTSLEGFPAGGSIPYSIHVARKQPYLHTFLNKWKSDGRGRSRAMPHIKTYGRPSPSGKELAWFLITSANLSKAAWGAMEKKGSQLMIRSYELGVLFLPKFFDKQSFKITSDVDSINNGYEIFPLPYDLPVTPYSKGDRPWIWDIPYKDLPDTNGNMWCPS